jgi:hypothetical protein
VHEIGLHGSESVILVFDGYVSGPDTNDSIHLRRTKGIFGTKVSFTQTTPFRSKKKHFWPIAKTNKILS